MDLKELMQFNNQIIRSFLFLIFLLGIMNSAVFAHSPTTSSTLLTQDSVGWTLQIRASLTAFEYEVHTRYGRESYKTPEEFKNLMTDILAKELRLLFDDSLIKVGEPQIRLGHETVMVYKFEGRDNLNTLEIANSAFKNIYNSKNSLFIIKQGLQKNKFTLNKHNQFQVQLKLEGNQLINTSQSQNSILGNNENLFSLLIGAAILLTILGIMWYLLKK